ncbi:MAG: exodeoxyribonuclease V subunit gamma [Succinivibrio sp.]|nr:exodeoxyribonuclease V subunit gamma [Succinivibrio sp.]
MPGDPQFTVINSNDLDVLASACAEIIKAHPLADPLRRETVLLMNSGMRTYLSQAIASRNGIEAGVDYLQVWQFIWDLCKRLRHESDSLNRFGREFITWSLLGMQPWWNDPKNEFASLLSPLRDYIENDRQGGIMAYELCDRIADTFDQYQMYRPDWVRLWDELTDEDFRDYQKTGGGRVTACLRKMTPQSLKSANGLSPQLAGNVWQLLLWSRLRGNLTGYDRADPRSETDFRFRDRAQIIQDFCKDLDAPDFKAPAGVLPERVFIVGVSALPEQVIQFFSSLGRHCQVYLLFLNPCSDYWGDLSCGKGARVDPKKMAGRLWQAGLISAKALKGGTGLAAPDDAYDSEGVLQEGNALLTGLGRQGRDTLSLLLSQEPVPDFINCFVEPEKNSVLSCVKAQLLSLAESAAEKITITDDDSSLVFCSCHTPRREIEVLRDLMLQKFAESGGSLRPRDILVMTPNIESYAPIIEAVFGSVDPANPDYIPYSIADRSVTRQSPAADAILRLMGIGTVPVTVSFVLSLLSVKAIADAFSITPDEVDVISSWCTGARVHWALDAEEVQDVLGGNAADVRLPWTLSAGLSRLLEGYMKGRGAADGSYGDLAGSDAETAGKFWNFVRALKELRQFFKENAGSNFFASGAERGKNNLLLKLRDRFLTRFLGGDEGVEERSPFLKALGGMARNPGALRQPPEITLPILQAMLGASLSDKVDERSYLRGKVNFCSLVPMRAVPFKHIFILGLNDGAFPRRERAPGFNLLSSPAFFRRGDRSRSVDDRFLFLEALMSASDSLTLSYIGESPVDKSPLNPSPVVAELMDYLDDHFICESKDEKTGKNISARARLTLKARLNSYDPQNYAGTMDAKGQVRRMPSFDRGSFTCSKQEGAPVPRAAALGEAQNFQVKLPALTVVSPKDLADFMCAPCKAFLKNLGVSQGFEEEVPADYEGFELDFLTKGGWSSDLLTCSEEAARDRISSFERGGALPYGIFGEKSAEDLLAKREQARTAVRDLLRREGLDPALLDAPQECETDSGIIKVTSACLPQGAAGADETGILMRGSVAFPTIIFNSYSEKIKPKHKIFAAVAAACQALCHEKGNGGKAFAAVCDADANATLAAPFTPEEAHAFIHELCRQYLRGLARPVPVWLNLLEKAKAALGDDEEKAGTAVGEADFKYDSAVQYLFSEPATVATLKAEAGEPWQAARELLDLYCRYCETRFGRKGGKK